MEKGLTSYAGRGGTKLGVRQAQPGTQVRIQNLKLNNNTAPTAQRPGSQC